MADDILPLEGGSARVPHRWCRKCGKSKPLTEFYLTTARPSGNKLHLRGCKKCRTKSAEKWGKSHPEKRKEMAKRTHERSRYDLRRWLIKCLGSKRSLCKRRGVECTITVENIIDIYEGQKGLCALTGRRLIFGSKGRSRDSLSFDRIDNTKGYILGNVRLVTDHANKARSDYSDDDLIALCKDVLATLVDNHPGASPFRSTNYTILANL